VAAPYESIWIFFGAVIVISLSGVMSPGPVFAATIAKGYKDGKAGIKIALGHGLVEFPLMLGIALMLDYFYREEGDIFENPAVQLGIGIVGGTLLIYLGAMMIRARREVASGSADYLPYSSVVAGALTTSANPYFFMWWATIGVTLIYGAMAFGAIVVVVFAVVHWSCDLGWYTFTAYAVNRTKHLWTQRVQEIVFLGFGLFMIGFGLFFITGPAYAVLSAET
jgi:threonine/homoserine/homoserine lactone efflux protein